MNLNIIIIFALAACHFEGAQAQALPTDPVFKTTARLVGHVCYSNLGTNSRNQPLIDECFACFDSSPGKQQFLKCQTEVFGGPLDNVERVQSWCNWSNQPSVVKNKHVPYLNCLKREFKKAGLDMASTVLSVNDCQTELFEAHEKAWNSVCDPYKPLRNQLIPI